MVRQQAVSASLKGHKRSSCLDICNCKRLAVIALGVVVVFFFMSLGSTSDADGDNLRSGQIHQEIHEKEQVDAAPPVDSVVPPMGNIPQPTNAAVATAAEEQYETEMEKENLEDTVQGAVENIDEAEEEEVEKEEEGLLGKSLTAIGGLIKSGVSKILSNAGASDAEIEEVSQEVSAALRNETITTLEDKAYEIAQKKEERIDNVVDEELNQGMNAEDIEEDVVQVETEVVGEVRDEVRDVAMDLKDHLKNRAAEIEKKMLEQRLSAKLGRPIHLKIVDDEVTVDPNSPIQQQQQPMGGGGMNGNGFNNGYQQQQQPMQGGYYNNNNNMQQQQQLPQYNQQGGFGGQGGLTGNYQQGGGGGNMQVGGSTYQASYNSAQNAANQQGVSNAYGGGGAAQGNFNNNNNNNNSNIQQQQANSGIATNADGGDGGRV